VLAIAALYQWLGAAHHRGAFTPPGRFVDVGGHRLHVICSGSANPPVFLESGIAASSLSWASCNPRLLILPLSVRTIAQGSPGATGRRGAKASCRTSSGDSGALGSTKMFSRDGRLPAGAQAQRVLNLRIGVASQCSRRRDFEWQSAAGPDECPSADCRSCVTRPTHRCLTQRSLGTATRWRAARWRQPQHLPREPCRER